MTSTDVALREEKALDLIDSGQFAERVGPLLPDTLPVRRFLQVAKTAIRTNPDLLEADQRTLMGSLIRCAQDGLLPDGREAALTVFSTKQGDEWVKAVQYIPMIGGLRKTLAEYGWTLKTRVVHRDDEFEYVEEPPVLRHVPTRPGVDGGPMIAAYAVARHIDGRKLQIVLDAEQIAKRKAIAKTDNVWKKWPEAMWEKSAGHAIFDEIPRAERDRMVIPADNGVDSAIEVLYGPGGHEFPVRPAAAGDAVVAEAPPSGGVAQKDDSESQQAEPAPTTNPPAAGSAPGDDDDPEPQPAEPATEEPTDGPIVLSNLGMTIVPGGGAWGGKTLSDVYMTEDGRDWLAWAIRNKGRLDPEFYAVLEQFAAAAAQDAA